jgi:hypothetical protein
LRVVNMRESLYAPFRREVYPPGRLMTDAKGLYTYKGD